MKNWITFFSQTGSEIGLVATAINRWPDLVITNNPQPFANRPENELCKALKEGKTKLYTIPSRPTLEDYKNALMFFDAKDTLITLHGYLRIIPGEICDNYQILNGHPGRIWVDESLKGFNAQEKAWKRGDEIGGSVIHECVAKLDSGRILAKKECSIKGLTLDETYATLHDNSVSLWIEYLKPILG